MKPQNMNQLIELIQDKTMLNRSEIADLLNINLYSLNGIQTGELMPHKKTVHALAKMSGLTLQDMKHCLGKNIAKLAERKTSFIFE